MMGGASVLTPAFGARDQVRINEQLVADPSTAPTDSPNTAELRFLSTTGGGARSFPWFYSVEAGEWRAVEVTS